MAQFDAGGFRSGIIDIGSTKGNISQILESLSSEDYFVASIEEEIIDSEIRPLSAAECAETLIQVVTGWKSASLVLLSRGVYVSANLDAGMPVPWGISASLRIEAAGHAEAFRLLRSTEGLVWEKVYTLGHIGRLWNILQSIVPVLRTVEPRPRMELLLSMLTLPAAKRRATAEARRILRWSGLVLSEDVTFLLRRTDVGVAGLLDWAENVAVRTARKKSRSFGSLPNVATASTPVWTVDLVIVGRSESIWSDGFDPLPSGDFSALLRVRVRGDADWLNDNDLRLTEVTPNDFTVSRGDSRDRIRRLTGDGEHGPVWGLSIVRESRIWTEGPEA